VVWNDRLFLFWLQIIKEAPDPDSQVSDDPPPNEDDLAGSKPSTLKSSAVKAAKTNTKLPVKAVLCWSEYYNGKWQPMKTSEIDQPIVLSGGLVIDTDEPLEIKPTESKSIRRKLDISVFEEGGALRVNIHTEAHFSGGMSGNYGSSFLLYNTHSLPEAGKQVIKSFYIRRYIWTHTETFYIQYQKGDHPVIKRNVLKNKIDDRTVAPLHSLQNPWEAPFFYEDSRQVFFVTTSKELVPVPAWDGFVCIGFYSAADDSSIEIPSLVFEEVPHFKPKPEPEPLMDGTSPIQRFVTEDAYIDKAIGTMGTIPYNGVEIAMQGGLINEI